MQLTATSFRFELPFLNFFCWFFGFLLVHCLLAFWQVKAHSHIAIVVVVVIAAFNGRHMPGCWLVSSWPLSAASPVFSMTCKSVYLYAPQPTPLSLSLSLVLFAISYRKLISRLKTIFVQHGVYATFLEIKCQTTVLLLLALPVPDNKISTTNTLEQNTRTHTLRDVLFRI